MRVVVTGGSGKAGRWIVRELMNPSDGSPAHDVLVFDRVPPPEPGVPFLAGDVTDLGQVYGAFAGADAIIHAAAIAVFGITTEDVTFRVNCLGTWNVHEAAYRLGIKRVVSCSSQAILGFDFRTVDFLPEYLPLDEDHPVKPQDAYGLSKEVGESIARSYARKGLETVVIRPNTLRSIDELREWKRNGGRVADRFLLQSYVDSRDLAVAFRLSIEKPVPPGTILFIVADDTAVGEPLCDVLPRFMPEIREMAAPLTGTKPAISNARAKEILGWQPVYSWRDLE